MSKPATAENQHVPEVFDWNALTGPGAICELAKRIGVSLRVTPDGKLKASGNTKALANYLSDIAGRYRGALIAHLLNLPLPELPDELDSANLTEDAQALDVAITEYCAASRHAQEYRDKLLLMRRRMAPAYLVQNICAFRAWLYEASQGHKE